MLVPVLPLVFGRAVFDQPALATDKATCGQRVGAVSTILRTLGTLATLSVSLGFQVEADIAINPITHLFCFYLLAVPAATLYRENHRPFNTSSRKANHFAVIITAGIWASAGEIEEDIFRGYEERMREENLGVRRRLM